MNFIQFCRCLTLLLFVAQFSQIFFCMLGFMYGYKFNLILLIYDMNFALCKECIYDV